MRDYLAVHRRISYEIMSILYILQYKLSTKSVK